MLTEQAEKYREILTTAQTKIEEAKNELMRIAHDQKVAYRAARLYAYRLQKAIEAMGGSTRGN